MRNKAIVICIIGVCLLLDFAGRLDCAEKNTEAFKLFYNEAKAKYAAGNLLDAITALGKAVELDPENEKGRKFFLAVLVEMGSECAHKEDWQNAIVYFERAKTLVPLDKEIAEMYQLVREMKDSSEGSYESETGMPDVEDISQKGNYRSAYEKMQKLGAEKSTDIEVRDLFKKLKMIAMTVPAIKGADPTSEMLKKGVAYYLAEDPKGAINTLQYFSEKHPENMEAASMLRSIKAEYPDVAKDESISEGMNFVESKLYRALNFMYDNKFDLAINECNAVLDLEPDNAMALLRQGSAYYSLGMRDRALESWAKAKKIDPSIDDGLQDFVDEKKVTLDIKKDESVYDNKAQKDFEESISYYQKMEKQLDTKGRTALLDQIITKYKPLGVDVSRIESTLKDLQQEGVKRKKKE